MPNIINLTVEQLRAMTRAQIRQSLVDYFSTMTKREMILWLLETDLVQDAPSETFGADGQITRRVEYYRDVETGAKVKGKITTWSYYAGGEVNVIRIADLDASDGETGHIRIKHYLDGREPRITENGS